MDIQQIRNTFFNSIDFDSQKKIYSVKPEFIKNENRIYAQALRHNVWIEKLDIIKNKFPNENDVTQQYRANNKRQFTKEVPRKAVQGVVKVLSNITLYVDSQNDKFNTWLNSQPFYFQNNRTNFVDWSINVVIPYSFIDPNGIIVPVPEFISKFEPVIINTKIIAYNKKFISPDGEYFLIFQDGMNYFLMATKTEWHKITIGKEFNIELIYEHNLGELPFVSLPGLFAFDSETNKPYNESLLSSTYEYLDESLVTFSTDQAVRTKMNSVMIRPGFTCKVCNGNSTVKDSNGKSVSCKSCDGTGLAKRPSDLDDFVVPPTDTIQGDGKIPLVPQYINPDTSVAEFHSKTWKEYLFEAKRSIGIDALIDRSESGEAMKKRLGAFEEFIGYLLNLTYKRSLQKYLELIHKLLNINQSDWVNFPVIWIPTNLQIKTPEILRDNYLNAIGAERLQAAFEYYENLYTEDANMQRVMRLLIENYPASMEKTEELQTLQLIGVFTSREIAKAKRAFLVIKKIIEGQGVKEISDEQVIQQTETILDKLIPDQIEISTV